MGKKKLRMSKRQSIQLAALTLLAATSLGVAAMALTRPAPASEPVRTVAAKATPTPVRVAPTVAFLGDSYTAGTGADPVDMRWTSQLSRRLDWTELNRGQGGTGYASQGPTPPKTAPYPTRIPTLLTASTPGLVIVSGGRNDLSIAPDVAGAGITETFQQIRKALPKAKIVALNPWGDDDPAPKELAALAEQVQAAVEAVGGTYVDAGQPLEGHTNFVISDGVHPNTAGHTAIAEAVATALPAQFKAP